MAAGSHAAIATDEIVEEQETRSRDDVDETAPPLDRHRLERVETGERQELVRCRECGRTGVPNEVSPFEFCPKSGGTVGMRTDSMLGVPSGGKI